MSTIYKILSYLLISTLPFISCAQSKNGTDREKPDLKALLKALDSTMKQEHMPGLMLSIVTRDTILYSGGLGYSDLKNKIKVNSSTLFHMESVTKMFTALAIQKLIREGKLKLNDQLKLLAPEIAFKNAWEKTSPVRVVHLMEHTAGFDDVHLNSMFNRSGYPLRGLNAVRSVSTSLVSRWPPGERMSYSNPDYTVLGYLIEKISGRPWNEYVKENVLLPLGMERSNYDLNGLANPEYAKGYYSGSKGFEPFFLAIPGGNGAGSALVSDADDLSRFLKNLLNDWKTVNGKWLSEQDLDEMEKVHSTLAAGYGLQTGYALANELFPNNKKITFRGHNGTGEGFNSWIFYNRTAGFGYSICNNGDKGMWPISELIERYLTKALKKPELHDTPGNLNRFEPFCGYYLFANPRIENMGYFQMIFGGLKLSISGDKLVISPDKGRPDTLINTGGNLFRASNDIIPSFVIGRDKQGKPFFQGYGNGYYKREAYGPIFLQKILLFASIGAMILSIIIAFLMIILGIFKRVRRSEIFLTLLPALGVLSLIAAYHKLKITDEINKAAFSAMNYTTIYIYLATLGFGLFILASLWFLSKYWTKVNSRWLRGLLIFNNLFIFYIFCLLLYHGWIGIRIWSL